MKAQQLIDAVLAAEAFRTMTDDSGKAFATATANVERLRDIIDAIITRKLSPGAADLLDAMQTKGTIVHENAKAIRLRGEQHETFEETLPKGQR